jgi:hypothetical protein
MSYNNALYARDYYGEQEILKKDCEKKQIESGLPLGCMALAGYTKWTMRSPRASQSLKIPNKTI